MRPVGQILPLRLHHITTITIPPCDSFFTANLEKLPFQAHQLRAYQSPNLLQGYIFIRPLGIITNGTKKKR